MSSVSDVCNMALSHVGSDATITSITPPDGSVEAGHCARFYPLARAEALEGFAWTWAKKRAALATVANDSLTWTYAYTLPSDCLRPLRVLQSLQVQQLFFSIFAEGMTTDDYQMFTERGSADFEVENGVIRTHEPDAILLYVRDITDTTKFTPSFVSFLSYLLASYIAGPIIKGAPGVQASSQLRQAAARVMGESSMRNANSSAERADHVAEHLLRRS